MGLKNVFAYSRLKLPYPKSEHLQMFNDWYLFVIWSYLSHLRTKEEERYHVTLLRVKTDQPYSKYIRDNQGIYIPGSLVRRLPPGQLWEYGNEDQLGIQLERVLQLIEEAMPWLEDAKSTMGYEN